MILTSELLKLRLKKLGIRADKFLGQHFLVDAAVLEQTIETAQSFLAPDNTILEVGPGLGVLTEALVDLGQPVIAIEKDPIFARELAQFMNQPSNLHVIEGDVLRHLETPDSELNSALAGKPWVVVANIPYGITSPLLRMLLFRDNPPHAILILVQKEVAERITAKPGNADRGLLSVEAELMAEPTIIAHVPRTSFWPEPKVDSALLQLTVRPPQTLPVSLVVLRRALIAGFHAKRKKLHNSLSQALSKPDSDIKQLLELLRIDPNRRAETLSIDEWIRLAEALDRA